MIEMMAYQDNVVSLRDSSRESASFSARPEFLRTVNACRQALLKPLPVLNAEFYANLDDALFKLADKAVSNTAQSCYFDTMRELRKQRDAMESRFNSSLLQHFDHFWRDGPSHQEADQPLTAFASLSMAVSGRFKGARSWFMLVSGWTRRSPTPWRRSDRCLGMWWI
ncbi:MAG: DUF1631 family protein [Candidatus Sedimenticola endophacoides]